MVSRGERNPEPKVVLRPAREDDAPELARIFEETRDVHLPFLPALAKDHEAHFVSAIDRAEVCVAEDARGIAGFSVVDGEWLPHLYVRADATGGGIGSLLLEQAKRDRALLRLWVFERNVGGLRFYARHGFVEQRRTHGENEEREPDVLLQWRRD